MYSPRSLNNVEMEYVYALTGRGPFRLNELLLLVFSFLPLDRMGLLHVSNVCHAWCERVESIPQWMAWGYLTRTTYLATAESIYFAVQKRHLAEKLQVQMRQQAKIGLSAIFWGSFK